MQRGYGFDPQSGHIQESTSEALTGVAQLVRSCPTKQKVAGLIPGQGTCLSCRFGPWLECVPEAKDRFFSLTSLFSSSLYPSLPLSIKIN